MTMHPDQLAVELRTVRKLLDGQFPHLRGASVEKVNTTGTVNAIFRIGPDLAETSTVPTNEPVALGEPGDGYPGRSARMAPGVTVTFQQAMGLVWYYVDSNPSMSHWG